MRRIAAFCVALGWAGVAMAEDWTPMSGDQILTALDDRTLVYEGAITQRFYASGKTLYDNGRPSWGNWAVRGDQYCSEWPPADGWTCYDLELGSTSGHVRFVSESGNSTEGMYVE